MPLFPPSLLRALLLLAAMTSSALPAVQPSKTYALWDDKPAPLDLKGWERNSFPLGNGHFGVSFFGGVGEELWQFTDKSLYVRDPETEEKRYDAIGLSNLCELRLVTDHRLENLTAYHREVNLHTALGVVRYKADGVEYLREHFASYPDNVFAVRITASQPGQVSFRLQATHPYLSEFRAGRARAEGDQLVLDGETLPYGLKYQVRVSVKTGGGHVSATADGTSGEITVEGANFAEVYVTLGTNYRLDPQVFLNEPDKKLEGFAVPEEEIKKRLTAAMLAEWETLRDRHIADHSELFGRARIDLGGADPGLPTDRLQAATDLAPPAARYLEELYFQFGRYLLIASSRPGTLPANLQGAWNMTRKAPWTGGYWANINIQMNYWPAFVTGLDETFEPYAAFWKASFPAGQTNAASTLASWKRPPAEDAWTAGTANSPFRVSGPGPTSGAGTGPFVILNIWEWYQYTGDKHVLEQVWPFLLASSRFLAAALVEQPDGTLLCDPSWSPEQKNTEGYVNLPGTAYDQQLVYENHRMTLEAAKILGKTDPILATLEKQLPQLSPAIIGASGQIKEFRQENAYGEIGDPKHRHISQLIGLFPGTVLTTKPEWLEASRVTLDLRGDKSTGWAMAHRLNAWTRVKDGQRCLTLLQTLLSKGTLPNLWDTHPPFQIDGNFGGTSGIANMLLQSHEGFIDLLPALPKEWGTGSFNGLRAIGAFEISAQWREGKVTRTEVLSKNGGPLRLRAGGLAPQSVTDADGRTVPFSVEPGTTGVMNFLTRPGGRYVLSFAGATQKRP